MTQLETRTCTICGTEFTPKPRARPDTKWCSWKCSQQDWRNRRKAEVTGFCATCSVEVGPSRKFCSIDCRIAASQSGRSTVDLICGWCGSTFRIQETEHARGGGRYCSHRCAQRDRAERFEPKPITPEFGHWLAGLTDGEGCFSIILGHTETVRFDIGLRADDRPMLEIIQATLGFGAIQRSEPKGLNKDGTRIRPKDAYTCRNVRTCAAIKEVFDKYPLRSKKARDFKAWSLAVSGLSMDAITHDQLARLQAIIKNGRDFVE